MDEINRIPKETSYIETIMYLYKLWVFDKVKYLFWN